MSTTVDCFPKYKQIKDSASVKEYCNSSKSAPIGIELTKLSLQFKVSSAEAELGHQVVNIYA